MTRGYVGVEAGPKEFEMNLFSGDFSVLRFIKLEEGSCGVMSIDCIMQVGGRRCKHGSQLEGATLHKDKSLTFNLFCLRREVRREVASLVSNLPTNLLAK